ncbi:hypothetical protein ACQJBY_051796 [Aegilops geniculata]
MELSKPSVFLGLLLLLACAGSGHGMRLLHDIDDSLGDEEYAREFAFGSMAAAETALQDASLDDYEDEISRVEFEPGRGASYDATVAAAAPGPAPGPATAGSDAAGTGSMKWWLPPSTMPSFPMFPNPGGMPGMPLPAMPVPLPALPGMPAMPMPGGMPGGGMPLPMPGGIPGGGMPMPMPGGMPFNFKPEGWGGGAGAVPSPPSRAQLTPPAAGASDGANDSGSDNPNPNGAIH